MDTTTLLLVAGALYLLLKQPTPAGRPAAPARPGGYAQTGPGGTAIAIPGISYLSAGGTTRINLDPRLFEGWLTPQLPQEGASAGGPVVDPYVSYDEGVSYDDPSGVSYADPYGDGCWDPSDPSCAGFAFPAYQDVYDVRASGQAGGFV